MLLWWSNHAFDQLLITKVRADLAVAHGYFERVLGEVGASTAAVADSHALALALQRDDADAVVALLHRARSRQGLDFINLRGERRHGCASPTPACPTPPRATRSRRWRTARTTPASRCWHAAQQGLLGAGAARARRPCRVLATRNAAPSTREREERAMVLLATRAVRARRPRCSATCRAACC